MLDDLPLDIRKYFKFQKDGAPAHNTNIVLNYLNEHFSNQRKGIPVQWPPKLSDLTPLFPLRLLENSGVSQSINILFEQIMSAINCEFLKLI